MNTEPTNEKTATATPTVTFRYRLLTLINPLGETMYRAKWRTSWGFWRKVYVSEYDRRYGASSIESGDRWRDRDIAIKVIRRHAELRREKMRRITALNWKLVISEDLTA